MSTKGVTENIINGCSILNGVNYFDRSQNYLIFQAIRNTSRIPTGDTEIIIPWKCFNNSKIEVELPNGNFG